MKSQESRIGGGLLNRKKILLIALLIIFVGGIIGLSYAYLSVNVKNKNTHTFKIGCLNIEMSNKEISLNLSNAVPVSDIDGLKQEAYEFSITNTCSTPQNYEINLESLNEEENTIESKHIRVSISSDTFDNIISNLNENNERTKTIKEAYESHNLYTGTLKGNQSKEFSFREWIDYATTNDEGLNKKYESKISVVVNPEIKAEEEIGIQFNLENKTITGTINGSINKIEVCESELNECEATEQIETIENKISKPLNIKKVKEVKTAIGKIEVNIEGQVEKIVCSKINEKTTICSNPYSFEIKGADLSKFSCLNGINNPNDILNTCSEETNGIYEAEDDYGMSYYYRGSINNNWVKFGKNSEEQDIWWRIIRINGNGSIRLIYAGVGKANEVSLNYEDEKSKGYYMIGNGINNLNLGYSSSFDDNAYVGYMYGDVGATTDEICDATCAYNKTHTNTNDSEAKKVIDTWYEANLKEEETYLDEDSGFCSDRSIASYNELGYSNLGYGNNYTHYGAVDRVYPSSPLYSPSYKCPNVSRDLYTVKNKNNIGNQALKHPIGLITADEAVYAGAINVGGWSTWGHWLHTKKIYYTISPAVYNDVSVLYYISSDGNLWTCHSLWGFDLLPVINLKSSIQILSGDGTIDNPYIVNTN